MDINEAIQQRHSVRAFLDKPVSAEQIEKILHVARHAPSGANTQPWQVAVITGKTRQLLQTKLQQAFTEGKQPSTDYQYYPTQWQAPYKDRRRECGLQLYQSLQIERHDKAKQQAQWAANYRAFDAPVLLLFFMDKVMETGSFLDYGMFLQSIMLAALNEGLATCPQAAFADYADITRHTLELNEDTLVICGMALGYEDTAAAVNQYRTSRAEVSEFTRFYD